MNGNMSGRQQGSGRASESPCPQGFTEQFWIDRLLAGGSDSSVKENVALEEHLRGCTVCRSAVELWGGLLPASMAGTHAEDDVAAGAWANAGNGRAPGAPARSGNERAPEIPAYAKKGRAAGIPANTGNDHASEIPAYAENGPAVGNPANAGNDLAPKRPTHGEDNRAAGVPANGRAFGVSAQPAAHSAEGNPSGGHAAPNDGGRPAELALPLPREAVRRKLRRRVLAIGRRRASAVSRRKGLLGGAAAVVVLLIAIGGLYRNVNDPADQRSRFVAEHEPMAAALVNDPATASYRVHPSSRDLGEGYVWFNDSSEEALVMLEGVLPSEGHVLQVWAVKGAGHANLGLLRFEEDNRAHLYVRGGALTHADNIALTVEPAGGSEMPTSPDAFVFRLQRR